MASGGSSRGTGRVWTAWVALNYLGQVTTDVIQASRDCLVIGSGT